MKARELRRKVLIRARMRAVATWSDVCILNISSRGMALQSARPPARGTYVEIRRGPHVIIACVIWSKHHRFGIRSQDVLFIDTIVAEPGEGHCAQTSTPYVAIERRSARRPRSADGNRFLSRAMEFACLGCLAALAATTLYGMAEEALAAPLATVSEALGN